MALKRLRRGRGSAIYSLKVKNFVAVSQSNKNMRKCKSNSLRSRLNGNLS